MMEHLCRVMATRTVLSMVLPLSVPMTATAPSPVPLGNVIKNKFKLNGKNESEKVIGNKNFIGNEA